MKACILYFSLSGNTRRFAEAISDSLEIPIFDLATSESSVVADFDVLILGTPVHGLNPANKVLSFVKSLPEGNGKKAILFCTYLIRKGVTLKKLEKELAKKGYSTILRASKRGFKPSKKDFSKIIDEIAKALKE
jgi:flavodoxin